ncbi:MAG: chemotaxis protein CheW [Desulfobacterales bacterium]|nr:chemotaxis protein CheW [Desulfobacterales bacterium]
MNKTDVLISEIKNRRTKEKIVEVDEKKSIIMIFTLSSELYGFLGEYVKEILPFKDTTFVPGTPDFIKGVINVRGDIEAVLNIHRLLNITSKNEESFIALVSKDGISSGVLVDTIEDVLDVPISSIKPPLETLDEKIKSFVAGEIMYNNKNVTILDIGKIFGKIVKK